jgi:glycosyltransferase involved in cell wall biosynthesis
VRIATFSYGFGPRWGGAERQAFRLGLALRRRGHEVLHVTAGTEAEPTDAIFDGLPLKRIPGWTEGRGRWRILWGRFLPALHRWLRSEGRDFDLWHVHGAFDPSSLPTALNTRPGGVPMVLKHASDREYRVLRRSTHVPAWLARRLHGAASLHVTNNPAFAGALQEVPRFGAVEVVPNGVELPDPASTCSRSALGLPEDGWIVANVANFHRGKNQELLIRAFAKARCRDRCWLVLAGDGAQLARCRQVAAQLGASERVCFLGRLDGVDALLQAADVFAFPSASEGMPNALLEAMAHGLPSLVADVPELTALVRPEREGRAVPLEPDAWAQALDAWADAPDRLNALGVAARERVRTAFHIDVIAQTYERLYARLL